MTKSHAFNYLTWFTFLSQDFPRLGHTVSFSLQEFGGNNPFQGSGKMCQVLVEVLKYFNNFLLGSTRNLYCDRGLSYMEVSSLRKGVAGSAFGAAVTL